MLKNFCDISNERKLRDLEFREGFSVGAVVQSRVLSPDGVYKDIIKKISIVNNEIWIHGENWTFKAVDLVIIRKSKNSLDDNVYFTPWVRL